MSCDGGDYLSSFVKFGIFKNVGGKDVDCFDVVLFGIESFIMLLFVVNFFLYR